MRGSLQQLDIGSIQIPYHFRCPISLELMTDPVTVTTGQTFDRSSIDSWVATGNKTCPVTRAALADLNFIPNHTLRRLIQDWCVANRSFGVKRIPTPKQPADPITIRSLLNQVSLDTNSTQLRVSALSRLRGLARDSDSNKLLVCSSKARDVLLNLVFQDMDSDSSELSHESLAILSMFTFSESECLFVATDLKKVTYLVSLLFHSSIDVRVNSAAFIESVIMGIKSTELRAQIGDVDGIFDGVIRILNLPLAYPRALEVGIKALFALCLVKQHRDKAVAAGAVAAIIDRLPDFEKYDSERALATVELLCRIESGCAAFAENALTVPLLVKSMLKISDRATEYAAGALLSLCTASETCRHDSVAAGVLTQLLLLVQSDCTERAKRKAQLLLKLLRDSWPEQSIAYSDHFCCSDVVPYRVKL